MRFAFLSYLCPSVFICGAILLGGCASQPAQKGNGIADRQDQALKDPMHYSPDMKNTDISGGGVGDFDKEGLRRDMDHVMNP